jgi:hypothetical protein
VVKTRIRNANFERNISGVQVIREMLVSEVVSGFFKGLIPRVRGPIPWLCRVGLDVLARTDPVVGLKLVFSYTLAQSLIPLFANYV